jgi:hypothetical protein|tara:strand:- start:619 stop:786 length:168 start_codon:yes stop_codon:yes gene_type:complete
MTGLEIAAGVAATTVLLPFAVLGVTGVIYYGFTFVSKTFEVASEVASNIIMFPFT